MNNKNPKVGRNLEEINEKNILNFGDLSISQSNRGVNVSWDEAWIKCERCNKRAKAKWKDSFWNLEKDWKVYMKKTQVKKHDMGYYIVAGIQFYCKECDWRHNYWEN